MQRLNFLLLTLAVLSFTTQAQKEFINPLKTSGPDPWVIVHDGFFYYTNTTQNNITLWKTKSISNLADGENKIVYTPPATGMYAKNLWAPEIHFIRGKWYIYFAADNGKNINHRIYVLENASADPLKGEWLFKGKLNDPGDHWAIDLTVIEHQNKLYAAWSGWKDSINGMQRIYIGELSDPWTMKGDRVEIAHPSYAWEKNGAVPLEWQKNGEVPEVLVNEGPAFILNDNKIFLTYSANACWLNYCIGLIEANADADLLDAGSWRKQPEPVFTGSAENGIYAPGHNGFFKSPDGREDWIIFHANPGPDDGCGNKRAPYIQPFTWNKNGRPEFGKPLPKKPIPPPSAKRK